MEAINDGKLGKSIKGQRQMEDNRSRFINGVRIRPKTGDEIEEASNDAFRNICCDYVILPAPGSDSTEMT